MWISIVIGGVIAVFVGWIAKDVLYWADHPMDHSNLFVGHIDYGLGNVLVLL